MVKNMEAEIVIEILTASLLNKERKDVTEEEKHEVCKAIEVITTGEIYGQTNIQKNCNR